MAESTNYKFQIGDVVLSLRPGLSKRVLEIIIPELPAQSGLIVRGEPHVEIIRHEQMLLIQPAKARELPVVAEAHERSKRQWGDQIPPYMAGVPHEKKHLFIFPEPRDED